METDIKWGTEPIRDIERKGLTWRLKIGFQPFKSLTPLCFGLRLRNLCTKVPSGWSPHADGHWIQGAFLRTFALAEPVEVLEEAAKTPIRRTNQLYFTV